MGDVMADGRATEIRVRDAEGKTEITIAGVIDEHTDLSPLAVLEGRLEFNLRDVQRLNSLGMHNWIQALRELAPKADLVFSECSLVVIDQLNMIHGFLGHGMVQSFYGAMVCESCDVCMEHLFEADACRELERLPPVACAECGCAMELDDDINRYLSFLKEPTTVDSSPPGLTSSDVE